MGNARRRRTLVELEEIIEESEQCLSGIAIGPAERADRRDLLLMWAGQSAQLPHCEDVNVLLSNLVTQVSELVGSVQRWSATRSSQSQPKTP
jgi:hypothetical protein